MGPRIVKSIQTQEFPKVVDFPTGNSADIDWYVRMPTDPPPVDPWDETLPVLCEEEGAIVEPTFPMIDSQIPYWCVCCNKRNMLVGQIQNVAG